MMVMNARGRIVDAWMQHPSRSLIVQPMLDPLRRWSRGAFGANGGDVPLALNIRAMDDAGVRLGLCCAWWGPHGPLVSPDAPVLDRQCSTLGVGQPEGSGDLSVRGRSTKSPMSSTSAK